MIRTVYCPSEDRLEEAEELAERHSLPITIGESESMRDLSFDRNSVLVVNIPTLHNLSMPSRSVHIGFAQSFNYVCDFVDFKESEPLIKIKSNSTDSEEYIFSPSYMESHIARFIARLDKPGTYYAEVIINDTVFAETELFEVTE